VRGLRVTGHTTGGDAKAESGCCTTLLTCAEQPPEEDPMKQEDLCRAVDPIHRKASY
jgi:hypothetical protein